jgi:hypothetical protein
VLKKFFLKVHPDRYAQYPTIAKANEQSFALLQSFLQHISGSATDNMPPPAKSEMLVFYTWSTAPKKESEAPKLRKISVNLRTSGGDCPNMVAKTLTDLFAQASVEPSVFTWDEGYWNNGKVSFSHFFLRMSFFISASIDVFWFGGQKIPTLNELMEEIDEEMAARETEEKGFKNSDDEEAFYRARARKQSESARKV